MKNLSGCLLSTLGATEGVVVALGDGRFSAGVGEQGGDAEGGEKFFVGREATGKRPSESGHGEERGPKRFRRALKPMSCELMVDPLSGAIEKRKVAADAEE
jgi:hypothetical protein